MEEEFIEKIFHWISQCSQQSFFEKFGENIKRFVWIHLKQFHPEVVEYLMEIFPFLENLSSDESHEKIVVRPTLGDLFEEKVLQLPGANGEIYWVPLWHHQLVFDKCHKGNLEMDDSDNDSDEYSDEEIVVVVEPILPENIMIDEQNHLHVRVDLKIGDIWGREKIDVEIGGRIFFVPREKLVIKEFQQYTIRKKGVPMIQRDSMYGVDRRGDIHLYIKLSL